MELLPCIVQDARTGEVLTLAYMNDEALERTRATGEMWFWSRSRQELWHKGATSGNVQRLKELRFDCDEDAILALVEPAGPGLPHGRAHLLPQRRARPGRRARRSPRSSARSRSGARPLPRRATPRACSRTASSWAQKVREEAEEVARAAREEPDERVAEEAADVLYHLAVLLAERGMELSDAYEVLNGRRR